MPELRSNVTRARSPAKFHRVLTAATPSYRASPSRPRGRTSTEPRFLRDRCRACYIL